MGLISFVLSFFNNPFRTEIEEAYDQPSDDHFTAPFAKRFKPNQSHSTSYSGVNSVYMFGKMSPKQYFSSKRKIPTARLPPPIEVQIPESDDDDDDCQIIKKQEVPSKPSKSAIYSSKKYDEDDEIQVLPATSDDKDVEVLHQDMHLTSSPCSSRSQKNHFSHVKEKPELYTTEDTKKYQTGKNKENNQFHNGNQNEQSDNEDDGIEVIEKPSKSLTKKISSNNIFPRWSNASHSPGRSLLAPRHHGSSFMFKRKHPHERFSNTLFQIQKLQSRDAYAKLIQAITHLNCAGSETSASPVPSSSRHSSTPPCSEVDILERLSTQGGSGSNPGSGACRHVSVMSRGNKSYVDISSGGTRKLNTSGSRFRFLDPGPQSQNRVPVVKPSSSAADGLDAMIRKIQSIDLHRFDSQISRRALALEKTNEKVRNLEVPSYNVLLEKTINLRKVPERLQVKKIEPQLPKITEDLEALVKRMKCSGRMDTVVSKIGLEEITKDQILSLEGLTWLKDNVINCYMALIMERSKGAEGKLPKVYGFNTFFHSALHEHGYARVKRWTKKVDLFSYDLLLVPIHVQKIHWCLATIDFRKKCVTYYDSMAGADRGVLNRLLNYLGDESMDKKKTPFDTSSWSTECPKDVPQQQNSCDCGVFTSTFGEYLSRNGDIFKVKQKDMPYYRKKMMVEILSKKLLT